jgi:hypothetical protein
MNQPFRITFTGADPSCAVDDLLALTAADPRVELGLLYSETHAGTGRYPPAAWIRETAERLGFHRVALHVCGRAVKKMIYGEASDPELGSLWNFERVQMNGRFQDDDATWLRRFIGPDSLAFKIITQFDGNPGLHEFCRRPSHQILFDASGGRGVERPEWPAHLVDWTCGYAGGLGPDNLRAELPKIADAAGSAPYWIDMESKLRDELDRFSIDKARLALAAIHEVEAKGE